MWSVALSKYHEPPREWALLCLPEGENVAEHVLASFFSVRVKDNTTTSHLVVTVFSTVMNRQVTFLQACLSSVSKIQLNTYTKPTWLLTFILNTESQCDQVPV